MKNLFSKLIILTCILSSCGQDNSDETPDNRYAGPVEIQKQEDPHAYSDSLPKGMMEMSVARQFKDSGSYVHEMKEGPWVEYTIDSSLNGGNVGMPVVTGGKINFACTVTRDEGNYKAGKENGTWKRFTTMDNRFPFRWDLTYETEYKNGLKDGNEIHYDYGDTLTIKTYKKDKLINKKIIHEQDMLKSKIWDK